MHYFSFRFANIRKYCKQIIEQTSNRQISNPQSGQINNLTQQFKILNSRLSNNSNTNFTNNPTTNQNTISEDLKTKIIQIHSDHAKSNVIGKRKGHKMLKLVQAKYWQP